MERNIELALNLRVKFGFNPYAQSFNCSFCGNPFENKPENKGLFLRLEVNTKVIDFPLCPACAGLGLFETQKVEIKDNSSHPIFKA